jgi:PAS domain S-box-containing protein
MATVTGRGFFATAGLLADALPDGVVVVDGGGEIVSVNDRLLAMTGYTEPDLLGSSVDDLVPADRRASHATRRSAFSANPVVRPMGTALNTMCQRADGSVFPADIALAPLALDGQRYVVATVRDATERRDAEEARREEEEGFRLLVESAAGVAIYTLDLDGRISSWNLGAERLLGYQSGEVIGQSMALFYSPSGSASHQTGQLLAEAAASGRADAIGWRVRKDGSRFQASVSITASIDRDGQLHRFTKITRDITAALRARDDVERLHLLEQREQLGRDLHDGAIQALFAVGMGLQALVPEVDKSIIADRLREAVRAIDDTIIELRAFIFGLNNDLTPAQVRHELERLVTEVRARSGIEVTGVIDAAALAGVGSRGRDLVLIAREALSNVERHSRASSCTVSLRLSPGDTVDLLVEDNGRGFDPVAAGGGLGLNNARARAREMGAHYVVDSSPTGTTVTLRIPVTA